MENKQIDCQTDIGGGRERDRQTDRVKERNREIEGEEEGQTDR